MPPLQTEKITPDIGVVRRHAQALTITGFVALLALTTLYGLHMLARSHMLYADTAKHSVLDPSRINRIGAMEIPASVFMPLPEFLRPNEERTWWQQHAEIDRMLRDVSGAVAAVHDSQAITIKVAPLGWRAALHSTWLIYLVGLLYALSAIVLARHDRSEAACALTLFLAAGAVYLMASAPVMMRGLTLPHTGFKTLVLILHHAECLFIALVHFTFVFPRRQLADGPHRRLVYAFYAYAAIVAGLYTAGVSAYGSSLPGYYFWMCVQLGALLHALLREPDRFLKKQASWILGAPLLVGLLFASFHAPWPWQTGATPLLLPFEQFALAALILAYALPAAVDSVRLYRQRLHLEHAARAEQEQLKSELHDTSLRALANISRLAEQIRVQQDPAVAAALAGTIERTAVTSAREMRGIFRIADRRYATWDELTALLRESAYAALQQRDIDFQLELAADLRACATPCIVVRKVLYLTLLEALENSIRHAQATRLHVTLSAAMHGVRLRIEDNGCGMPQRDSDRSAESRYGLAGIRQRVLDCGGQFTVHAPPAHGTRLECLLPLPPFASILR